jgi:hypothetical protein
MSKSNDSEAPPAVEDASELSDEDLDPVAGGARVIKPLPGVPLTPSPGGPVPIPYPNATTKE